MVEQELQAATFPAPAARTPPQPSSRWDLRTAALGLLTLFLVIMALLNLRQLWVYRQPTDGALWHRTTAGLEASAISPAARGRIQPGDLLVAISGQLVETPEAVSRQLYAAGIGSALSYTLVRQGRMFTQAVPVRASPPPLGRYTYLEVVGFFYLAIGLFVFYRRRSATQAWNFYLFCLASFVLFCFHFTGKLNLFDQTIFWFNWAALLLTPVLLLQFAAAFPRAAAVPPVRRAWRRVAAALLYLPALLLALAELSLATGAIWLPVTLSATQDVLQRAAYGLFALYFLAAALVFLRHSRRALAAHRADQARVMAWGTIAGLAPFLGLYLVPYLGGVDLPRFASLSVLSLICVPVAFGYAIWRHHLLEAEIIFRRGIVYTLSTALVVAAYWGVIGLAGVLIHSRLPTWGWAGWLVAILVTALLFEPVKHWMQERLDRLFYRERYDYRRTLIEFGRQMNAETDLQALLEQVLARLSQTLEVAHAAIYLSAGDSGDFHLARARGGHLAPPLPAGFLQRHFGQAQALRLFLEHPDAAAADAKSALHYFLPCQIQGRTVAVIALGRTVRGEFLSSDDVALVETLAGYLAIALENARLYATLRQKADEYQRLKDFNQNIVESIQVGVVATNMMGMVESWNAQMEVLTARPRQLAIGQPLEDLLGPEFAREFAAAAAGGGIHSQRKLRMRPAGGDATQPERIVNLAIAPLVTARYERVGHIVLLSDVTSEVEMEQKLIQADRLRSVGLLAAGVAHEVNTPLAVISSYAQLLAKQTPAGDPRAPVLETITRQTFRASEIVGNLLHFSRTGAAQFRAVEVNAVVRDTLALVEHPLRSAGIHLIAALHPASIEVTGDAGKLQQVFLNLILNARDAMPRGGTLTVATGRLGDEERAWIEVSDTGDGIPAELQHRIFDPFFTTKAGRGSAAADVSMSTGTGLGLAVTYGIVEEHGGLITVRNGGPGQGAAFRVELPLRQVQRPAETVAV